MNRLTDGLSGVERLEDAFRRAVGPIRDLRAVQSLCVERLKVILQEDDESSERESSAYSHMRETMAPIHRRIQDYQRSLPAFDVLLLGHLREMEIAEGRAGGPMDGVPPSVQRGMLGFYGTSQAVLQVLDELSEIHREIVDEVESQFREVGEILARRAPVLESEGAGRANPPDAAVSRR